MDNTYHLLVFSLEFYHISPLLKINREFAVAILGLRGWVLGLLSS